MKEILQDIEKESFKPVYLFYGEETYLLHDYEKRLRDALSPPGDEMNFFMAQGKDVPVREVIDFCDTQPFFAPRRTVLLKNTGFFKKTDEDLASYLKSLPSYAHILFCEEEVDKRSRMYKAASAVGTVVEFARLDEGKLTEWAAMYLARNGRRIREGDARALIAMTGDDMGNLKNELDKLIAYTEGQGAVSMADIATVCTSRTENHIFDMVSAVASKNQRQAIQLYTDLLSLREPPLRILFLITRQYRQMLLAKRFQSEGLSQAEIAKELGVKPFAVKNILSVAKRYPISQLEDMLEGCVQAEEDVKTGRLGDQLSVEMLIIRYSSATA